MDITPAIISAFRAQMTAFADVVKYPDGLVQTALEEALMETGGRGWGQYGDEATNFKRRGMFYYAAHWLATYYPKGLGTGAVNSEARLNTQNKAIGDESIAYRVPQMMEVSNDWLTFTVYGQSFYRLRKRAGMGSRAV